MKHLPDPVGEVLDQDADERRLRRNWEATRARLDGERRAPRFVLVGAAVVVAAVVLLWPRWSATFSPRLEGPLTVEGAAPVPVEAVATPRVLRFDDASTIELAPGTAIAPTRNEATRFDIALARGRARFEVTPGGPREWTIDAGLARVRVLGTAFVVEREATHVRVAVEHGHVRVEGALVRGGRIDLHDGESLLVERAAEVATRETGEPAHAREPGEGEPGVRETGDARETGALGERDERATRDERTRWRELAERGEHEAAFAVLSGSGVAQRSEEASPRELLLLADVARLSGHPDDAVAPLTRLIERHVAHAEAPLAAITLARIHASRGRPAEALRAYERAAELGAPSVFDAEVCTAVALGRRDAQRAAACLARHPEAPRAEALRAIASSAATSERGARTNDPGEGENAPEGARSNEPSNEGAEETP